MQNQSVVFEIRLMVILKGGIVPSLPEYNLDLWDLVVYVSDPGVCYLPLVGLLVSFSTF